MTVYYFLCQLALLYEMTVVFRHINVLTTRRYSASFPTMRQKALLLREAQTPVVLVDNHPIPQPNKSRVQVKVTLAGLNGHNQKVRDLGLFLSSISTPPVLTMLRQGRDGREGRKFAQKGGPSCFSGRFCAWNPQNGLQEYAVLTEQFTAKIPDSISYDDAAIFPTNIIATLVGLFHGLPIPAPWTKEAEKFDYKNATLLFVGGGSFAGRYAVQLAKIAGIGRIVVVGGKEDELKKYGATQVLDCHGGQEVVLERIR